MDFAEMNGKLVHDHVVIGGSDIGLFIERGYGGKLHSSCEFKSVSDIAIQNVQNEQPIMKISIGSVSNVVQDMDTDNPSVSSASNQNLLESVLVLKDEEAYYLSSNNVMTVSADHGVQLSSQELWTMFVKASSKFPALYKTYLYFKEKGYIVKGGMNYGVDYTIYRTLPVWCHSELCVEVIDARSSCRNTASSNAMTWAQLSAQTRITQDVLKSFVLCYVTENSILDNESAASIDWFQSSCLEKLIVRPTIVTNRRHNILNEKYFTATQLHRKIAEGSILKRSRQLIQSNKTKAIKSHQNTTKPISFKKKSSKHNKVWSTLQNPIITNSNEEIHISH